VSGLIFTFYFLIDYPPLTPPRRGIRRETPPKRGIRNFEL